MRALYDEWKREPPASESLDLIAAYLRAFMGIERRQAGPPAEPAGKAPEQPDQLTTADLDFMAGLPRMPIPTYVPMDEYLKQREANGGQ